MATVGEHDGDDAVGLVLETDGDDPLGARTGEVSQSRLADHALLGDEIEVMGVDKLLVGGEVLDPQDGGDAVVALDIEDILDRTSLGVACRLGDLEDAEPVAATPVGKEEEVGVIGGTVDKLDEVLVLGPRTLGTGAAAILRAILCQRRTLDVPVVRDGDDHIVIGVEVLRIHIRSGVDDVRSAVVAILVDDLATLFDEDRVEEVLVGEDPLVVPHPLRHLVVLLVELVQLEAGELTETHLHDGACLYLGEAEALHERLHGGGLIGRRLDQMDHLVDIVGGDDAPLEDVEPLLSLL